MGEMKKIKDPITKGVAKVPIVMQMEALECGAAALTMILAYFGKWVPLEKVRTDCGVSRDGSNAKNIIKAARNYGLNAKGYKFEPEILKEKGTFPCIVHWEFNHFVVCNGFKGDKVFINDPAKGMLTITMEEFDKGFTGIALLFSPTSEFVADGNPKSVIGFAGKRLKGASAAVAFVALTMVIVKLLELISPAMTRFFMDELLMENSTEYIMPFFALLGLLCVIQVITAWIMAVYSLRINGKLAVVGNTSYMWKVLGLPMEFFAQRTTGDIQMRKNENESVAQELVDTVGPLFINTVMMIFYFIVMMRYSVILTIVGLISVILNITVSQIISRERVNITRVQMRDEGKLITQTINGIEMIETIKVSGAENGFFGKWAGYQASVITQKMKYEKISSIIGMLPLC
nr:NHLP family bacteriocin export ABC transporter peptidase/permease/ATPase [Butyrivibrio sp.]